MTITVEEIVSLYKSRRETQGPVLAQMRRVRDLANGDVIVPLNELDRNARTSTANLLVQGLDQTSMRVASTMPMPYFPPVKEGNERSKELSRTRRKAILCDAAHATYSHTHQAQSCYDQTSKASCRNGQYATH